MLLKTKYDVKMMIAGIVWSKYKYPNSGSTKLRLRSIKNSMPPYHLRALELRLPYPQILIPKLAMVG